MRTSVPPPGACSSTAKRLLVVDDGALVGIISRHDLVRLFHRPDADIAAEIEAKLKSPRYSPEDHAVTFTVNSAITYDLPERG